MDDTETGDQHQREGENLVFVSYSRDDQKVAAAIISILGKQGYSVWWDGLIPGGDRFEKTTSDALERAGAVVVLWSKVSVGSHWVHDEAARGRDRRCLIPLSIDGSEPPLGFRQFQYLDVSREPLKAESPTMQRALRSLAEVVGRAPTPAATPPFAGSRVQFSRRTILTAAGVGAAAAVGGATAWVLSSGGSPRLPNSIAVLPFDNLSNNPDQRYFSDGLAAELRAQLARNPMLNVMGQASSNQFRDSNDTGQAIANKLEVTYLLDGNVRVAGNQVRIAIELIEGRTGFSKWSNSYDQPLTNIFKLQEDIAAAVTTTLAAKLGNPGTDSAERSGGTRNLAAFDAYLRGKTLFESQLDEGTDRAALARFEQAVRLDPLYAAARAARSRALAVIANQYVQAAERKRLYHEAVAEAQRSVRDAAEFADGHAALGYALFYGSLDVIAADAPYKKAHDFGLGSADVQSRYALYHARRRQFAKANPAIARAVALDPLNPSVFKTEGLIRFASGDFEGAITSAKRALEINPKRGTLHGDIGNALVNLGRVDEASAAFAIEKMGLLAIPGRAFVAARRGDNAAVSRAYDELVSTEGDNGLYQQAQILAQWGKFDRALDALDAAKAQQDAGLVLLLNDPFLKPLALHPRFIRLLRQLHFV
ncbi:MAG: TIR domain-containing protein [Sphingomonas sp.]